MRKKYLEQYSEKIAQMSEEEEKARNIYLQKFSKGEYWGPKTFYPSMDKTWLQYYPDEALLAEIPNESIYEFVKKMNKDNLDAIAISYLGKKLLIHNYSKKLM